MAMLHVFWRHIQYNTIDGIQMQSVTMQSMTKLIKHTIERPYMLGISSIDVSLSWELRLWSNEIPQSEFWLSRWVGIELLLCCFLSRYLHRFSSFFVFFCLLPSLRFVEFDTKLWHSNRWYRMEYLLYPMITQCIASFECLLFIPDNYMVFFSAETIHSLFNSNSSMNTFSIDTESKINIVDNLIEWHGQKTIW